MAKRTKSSSSRPEKRVLARQEVTRSGKPAPTRQAASPRAQREASGSEGGHFRNILALGLFLGAIGTVAALFSFHREDSAAEGFQNLVGPMGHRLAFELFGVFGITAYLVPVAVGYASVALFVKGRSKRRGRQLAGVLILALAGAILAHLAAGDSPTWSYPPGGAVGAALGESLRALFSTFGAVLVTTAIACAGLVLATDSAFARLCVVVGRAACQGAAIAKEWLVDEAKKQYANYKLQRAQRALERAEEEAAFAQAMADAEEAEQERFEELSRGRALAAGEDADAEEGEESGEEDEAAEEDDETDGEEDSEPSPEELIASEADEIAEEAARIARETEARRAQLEAESKAREAAARAAKRARASPAEDPAWVMDAPAPEAQPAAEAAPAPAPAPEVVEQPKPILSLPPKSSIPPTRAASLPPTRANSLPPQPSANVQLPAPAVPADARPEPAGAVGPVLPVIVEPKAPPRAKLPDKKDPFAFEGNSNFSLPPLALLEENESQKHVIDKEAFFSTAEKLREKLASFGIAGQVKEIRPGPVVTMYEFEPAPGIKISKIASLSDDLAMAMEALRVRIVAPIPGKGVVGIEVPNKVREGVYLRDIVEQEAFLKSGSKLALAIGKNIEGQPYVTDLTKMPHLLIAGTTGSGKSVSVNAMIMSILFKSTPEEVRMIMVDPKVTELSIYEGIPHLLLPVVTDARKAALALRWAVEEMERRYQLLADAGVRNIGGYNKYIERMQAEGAVSAAPSVPAAKPAPTGKIRIIDVAEGESEDEALARASSSQGPVLGVPAPTDNAPEDAKIEAEAGAEAIGPQTAAADIVDDPELSFEPELPSSAVEPEVVVEAKDGPKKLPYIVIIIDEVADLMMVASREVETYVARLAQMARAAGIHLMIATQRPSTDVITGVIKANFPSRISFQLRSKPDSMTILGTVGAEALLGMGDMLILPPTSAHLERVHGAYVSDQEISKVVAHLRAQGKPVYDESILKPRDEEGEEEGGGSGGGGEMADEMYDQCLAIVSDMHTVSVSMLQRKLRLGYNRAARIIERMEREGIVGPANGSKPREVLIRPVGQMHQEVNL